MTASAVRARVNSSIWSNYFKFSFERNPWDKAISFYYYSTHNQEKRISLLEYLTYAKKDYISNFGIYSFNDQSLAVDHVAFYENLENELESFPIVFVCLES